MRDMKRPFVVLLAILLVLLPGCGKDAAEPSSDPSEIISDTSGTVPSATQTSADRSTTLSSETSGTTTNRPSATSAASKTTTKAKTTQASLKAGTVIANALPQDGVKTLKALGVTADVFKKKAKGGGNYTGNSGWDCNSVVISPDYTLTVNGTTVPVYATPVMTGSGDREGSALQSFAMIDVREESFFLDMQLTATGVSFEDAMVLPQSLGVSAKAQANKSISARLTKRGVYTIMLLDKNGDETQQHAFVLMVRGYADEDSEIAAYRKQYGEDHVTVYEAGVHEIDYIEISKSKSVIYLRRGAYLVLKHTLDIRSDADNSNKSETGAAGLNGWGLNRHPVINAKGKNDIRIVGRGAIDAGRLDWHERRGLLFSSCTGLVIEGIQLVNFPEWTVTTYCCKNVQIRDLLILGWKTNSDGIALCNTTDATVDNCFARSGDDLFEVKTLGAGHDAKTKNVTFTHCYAWNGAARCFGVTSEAEKDIEDVTFRDCAVIYRDATWNNDILGSLVVIAGVGKGNISDILFSNIEIYYDHGRPITLSVDHTDQAANQISNIVFDNVTYTAAEKCLVKTNTSGNNRIEAVFKNVTGNGMKITALNRALRVKTSGPNSIVSF